MREPLHRIVGARAVVAAAAHHRRRPTWNTRRYRTCAKTCVDVGVDAWGYRPVTLAEIDAHRAALPLPVDCHGRVR